MEQLAPPNTHKDVSNSSRCTTTDCGILHALVLDIVIATVLLLVFVLFVRKRFRKDIGPEGMQTNNSKISSEQIKWSSFFFCGSAAEARAVRKLSGSDSYLYLSYQRYIIYVLILLLIAGIGVLIPLFYHGDVGYRGVESISAMNLSDNHEYLWGVLGYIGLFSILSFIFLLAYTAVWFRMSLMKDEQSKMSSDQQHQLSGSHQHAPQHHELQQTSVGTTEELVLGDNSNVTVRNRSRTEDAPAIVQMTDFAVQPNDSAHQIEGIQLSRSQVDNIKRREFERYFRDQELDGRQIQNFAVLVSNVEIPQSIKKVGSWAPWLDRMCQFVSTWFDRGDVVGILIPEESRAVNKVIDLLNKKKWASGELAYLERLGVTSGLDSGEVSAPRRYCGFMPGIPDLSEADQKRLAYTKNSKQYTSACEQIDKVKKEINNKFASSSKGQRGHVFFIFSNLSHANRFREILSHSRSRSETRSSNPALFDEFKVDQWRPWKVPHPSDILFSYLNVSRWKFWVRAILINIPLMFLLFFFTTPAAIAGAISQNLNEIEPIRELRGVSLGIVQLFFAWLPTILVLVVGGLIPVILKATSRLEGHRRRSRLERSVARKIFGYLLLITFILPSLVVASASAVISTITTSQSFDQVLSQISGVYNASIFFIIYIVQHALIKNLLELLHIKDLIKSIIVPRRKPLEQKEEEERDRENSGLWRWQVEKDEEFHYGEHYAKSSVILVITLFYSPVSPLIIAAGLLYFITRRLVDKHDLICVFPYSYFSDKMIARTVVSFFLTAVVLTLIGVSAFFAFTREADTQSIISIILAGCFLVLFIINHFPVSFVFRIADKVTRVAEIKDVADKLQKWDKRMDDSFYLTRGKMVEIRNIFLHYIWLEFYKREENIYHDGAPNPALKQIQNDRHFDIWCDDVEEEFLTANRFRVPGNFSQTS
eukprot:TRINITY_DN4485_c0_g2_i1.p1 TRINITY_DN4485_c0_g2~~TRINITY_DN4485_c0_g2_i1.p1  ORF type:complete len:953 (+),score=216.00 TRINITY_DN4485_c0_g2_i1:57-2861(+)